MCLRADLTISAPPPHISLDEVIQLWDFLLAYGVHLNILCVIAQLLQMRTEVMDSPSFVFLPLFSQIPLVGADPFRRACETDR